MNKEIIIKGWLGSIDHDHFENDITLDGVSIFKKLNEIEPTIFTKKHYYEEKNKIWVNYYISNNKEESIFIIEETYIRQILGELNYEYGAVMGTSITGCYGFNTDLQVGGHNIAEELSSFIGKYCIIKILIKQD